MGVRKKLDVLRDAYSEEDELHQILGKLLEVTLEKYRLRRQHHDQHLRAFKEKYNLDSETFYDRFGAGLLGDAMDFFKWAGLYELRRDLDNKIRTLEQVA